MIKIESAPGKEAIYEIQIPFWLSDQEQIKDQLAEIIDFFCLPFSTMIFKSEGCIIAISKFIWFQT